MAPNNSNNKPDKSDKPDKPDKDSTRSPKCYANVHMTPQQYGVYEAIKSLSIKTKVFYMNAKTLAACFRDRGPSVCRNLVKSLEASGWLKILRKPTRNSRGIHTATQYQVVSHEEWVKKNGTKECRKIKIQISEEDGEQSVESSAPGCTGKIEPDLELINNPDNSDNPVHQDVTVITSAPECNANVHYTRVNRPVHPGETSSSPGCHNVSKEYVSTDYVSMEGRKEGTVPSQYNPTSVGLGPANSSTTTSTSKTRASENHKAETPGETPGETLKPEATPATGEADEAERFLEALRQTWRDTRENVITQGWLSEDNSPSPSMPYVGIKKLVDKLTAAKCDIEDYSTIADITEAFEHWLQKRYYPAFNSSYEIHQPLTLFAEEYYDYLPDLPDAYDIPASSAGLPGKTLPGKASVASQADPIRREEQRRDEQERKDIRRSKEIDAALNAEFERRVREAVVQ